jgi:TetR/AcrR family transcriptional repressor of nem operon
MPWDKKFNVEAVLDKAMHAFWSRGYAATSMQDLVDCTGVNRASLYATYGDKRALFLAALEHYDTQYCRRQLDELRKISSPRDAITRLFEMFIETRVAVDTSGCFMTNTALELAAHDGEIGAVVAKTQKTFERFFKNRIEAGKAAGEIPARVPTEATARTLLSTLLGLAVLARSRPDRALLTSVANDALSRLQ